MRTAKEATATALRAAQQQTTMLAQERADRAGLLQVDRDQLQVDRDQLKATALNVQKSALMVKAQREQLQARERSLKDVLSLMCPGSSGS